MTLSVTTVQLRIVHSVNVILKKVSWRRNQTSVYYSVNCRGTVEALQYEINDQEVRSRLTDEQYFVTQHAGTERAFTGCYWDTKEEGKYHCIVCDAELFVSDTKFDSGTGWPSFFESAGTDFC